MAEAAARQRSQYAGIRKNDTRRTIFQRAWTAVFSGSQWLTITGAVMLVDILISLVGLVLDPTYITGAPAWMKPLKFGISTCLFSLTVAFLIGHLHKTRRLATILACIMAAALVIEILLIDMQAARHTSSHFNTATAFDGAVFAIMGAGIGVLLLSTILLLLAVCLEPFADRAFAWAARLSLILALAGMGTGVLMSMPTPEQLAQARAKQAQTHVMPRTGAHTVGASDGGPGLPLTGWSADHGDLRIAHFIGLHAMQLLLFFWWLTAARPRWTQTRQIRLIATIAASVAVAFGVVLWQALRGEPFLRPNALTLNGWVLWLVVTLAGLFWVALEGFSASSTFSASSREEKQ